MVSTRVSESQSVSPGFFRNHLKLSKLMKSNWLHSSVHSGRMRPHTDCHITINQVGRTSLSSVRTGSPGPAHYRPGGLGS